MYCEECGKKNAKGSKFCEFCGAKMSSKKEKKETRTKMTKKNKILIGIIIVIALLLIGTFTILSNKYKPETIAEEYFLALVNQDTNKLYSYLDVSESDFTTKEVFEQVVKTEKKNLLNYNVTNVQTATDGLSTEVTINYTLEGNSSSKTMTIDLVKDKKKNMLIFDNWKVSNETVNVVKNYEIKTPKNSTVTLAEVKVSSKYLDKDDSSYYDIYVIPTLFSGSYTATVTLSNGLTLEDDITVSSYGTANLTRASLSTANQKTLEKQLPEIINLLYTSAMDKKDFDSIKSNFEYDNADLSDLEDAYTSFEKSLENSGLTKITIKSVNIESNSLNSDGYLYVTATVKYNYTLNYTFFGEEKTKNSSTTDTIYLTFDYSKDYKLVDMSSMATYFSKY